MTSPNENDRTEAMEAARAAMAKATEIQTRGQSIAERWRKSQADNNFRHMLRSLGREISDAS